MAIMMPSLPRKRVAEEAFGPYPYTADTENYGRKVDMRSDVAINAHGL